MSTKITTPKIIDWTTDDRLKEIMALGMDQITAGNVNGGRAYHTAMGRGISFRTLQLREKLLSGAKTKGKR